MSKNLKRDTILYAIIFTVLSIPFFISQLDIKLSGLFYKAESGFYLKDIPFWDIIYKYGIFPGYLFAVLALLFFTYTYWKPSIARYRKWALMLIFTVILGPGLLVNATFKDHWGRPRPNEIVEFGGKETFIKPWIKGDTGGKSFPCGHASMGFFFSIPFLFLRKKFKRWAWAFMVFGLLYGTLVGLARMIAGGHFASDVVWSAGFVWLSGLIVYYALNVEKEIDVGFASEAKKKKQARTMTVVMGIVLPLLIVTALLATPYISKKQFTWSLKDLNAIGMSNQYISFKEGNIDLAYGDNQQINYEVTGFGFPNSKIRAKWIEGDTTQYYLERLGWFTEVRNKVSIALPTNAAWSNHVSVEEGNIFITIPDNNASGKLNISVGKGDITITANKNSRFALEHNNVIVENEENVLYSKDLVDSLLSVKASLIEGKITIISE